MREKLGDPRKVTNWMDKFYKFSKDVEDFYLLYRFESGKGLESKHVKEYTVNACTLKAAGLLKTARTAERLSKRGSLRGIPTTIWKDAIYFKKVQQMKYGYEHTLPANERRFLEALRKFDTEGLESLISRKHENKNAVKVTADVIELLNNLFAGRLVKPTAKMVFNEYMRFWVGQLEVINNETGEVYNRHNFPSLDDRTILAYLSRWENKIGTWNKRAGDRQRYQNQFKVTHRFTPAKMAGSILSVDDRNPPFILPNGKRVWFYIGIDLASEAWTTYVHGTTKEGIITDFYKNLVRDYASYGVGLPLELECESALNSGLTKGILEEGVLFNKIRIEKNNPTGKMIENHFRRIRYGLEKHEEGWQGRPFARSEANQTNTEKPIHKSYDEIVETTVRLMQEWNHSPHPRVEGKTRWEVFMENQNPECRPINWQSILMRMGKETQTSCRVGYINLNSDQWCIGSNDKIATGKELIRIMKEIEGRKIIVKWLDDKEGNVLSAKRIETDVTYVT
ncbi:hypothetical protein ACFFJX_27790 [Pseudarcicella hirudinis]|uniref:hypothetical protein n=1 Tax=Pseudarcicella hirudinis TaxID=1079859 RepID=UPI0035EEB646